MPSLDNLQSNTKFNNLKIFPINIGQEDTSKSEFFFKELNIKNLNIYNDAPITLAKKFALRGVPTTIIFNKEGKEFARIIGSIDFNDEEFINWLKLYN
jgi:thioredoxin-related protein